MQLLHYLLIICFINLYNSFTLIKYFSRYCKHKLFMGCDYYIDKDLHVYDYNDRVISYIELEHEKGYYYFASSFDEDDNRYDEELTQYIKCTLEPKMKPIMIYSNNTFNTLSFENKYKKMINYELDLLNKTWNDINKIIKIENRYKRE